MDSVALDSYREQMFGRGSPPPPVNGTGRNGFKIATARDVFARLEPVKHLLEPLDLCPGAPCLVAGYGFSGKTIAGVTMGDPERAAVRARDAEEKAGIMKAVAIGGLVATIVFGALVGVTDPDQKQE